MKILLSITALFLFAIPAQAQYSGKWMVGASLGSSNRDYWQKGDIGYEAGIHVQYLVPNSQWRWGLTLSGGEMFYQSQGYHTDYVMQAGDPWNAYYFDGVFAEPVLKRTRTRFLSLDLESQFHPLGRWFFWESGWLSPYLLAGLGINGHHTSVNALNEDQPYQFAQALVVKDFSSQSLIVAGSKTHYPNPTAEELIPAAAPIDWDGSYESASSSYAQSQWPWHYKYSFTLQLGIGVDLRLNARTHLQASIRYHGIHDRWRPVLPYYLEPNGYFSHRIGLSYQLRAPGPTED